MYELRRYDLLQHLGTKINIFRAARISPQFDQAIGVAHFSQLRNEISIAIKELKDNADSELVGKASRGRNTVISVDSVVVADPELQVDLKFDTPQKVRSNLCF